MGISNYIGDMSANVSLCRIGISPESARSCGGRKQ